MFPSRRTTLGGDVFRDEYSLEFDGTNDYVDCGTGIGTALGDSYDGGITVSLWMNANVVDEDVGLFDIGTTFDGHSGDFHIRLHSNDDIHLRTGGNVITTTGITAGTWNHVVGVFDGANNYQYLYFNGALAASDAQTDTLNFDGLKTIIGAYYNQSTGINGNISELAIWKTALSSNQTKQLYNGREPFDARNVAKSNLVSYWRMGDGTERGAGTTIYDMSANTNNGTMTNMDAATDYTGDTPR